MTFPYAPPREPTGESHPDRLPGVTGIGVAFVIGTVLALIMGTISVFEPNVQINPLWRGYPGYQIPSPGDRIIMAAILAGTVTASGLAAFGMFRRRRWGRRVALVFVILGIAWDLLEAIMEWRLRPLVSLPVGVLFLWYLLKPEVRAHFLSARTPSS